MFVNKQAKPVPFLNFTLKEDFTQVLKFTGKKIHRTV